jgi:hypothetical protein
MPSVSARGVVDEPISGLFSSGTRRFALSYFDRSP